MRFCAVKCWTRSNKSGGTPHEPIERRFRGNARRQWSRLDMRAFAWFVGVIVLAGLIGACIAYPAYELTSTFANWAFHRVASRIAMLVLVAELVWLCRHLNLTRARDFGYGLPWRRFLKVSCMRSE